MNDHVGTAVIVKSFGPLISDDQYGSSPNINSRYGVRIKGETLDLALCNVLTVYDSTSQPHATTMVPSLL